MTGVLSYSPSEKEKQAHRLNLFLKTKVSVLFYYTVSIEHNSCYRSVAGRYNNLSPLRSFILTEMHYSFKITLF